MLITLQPGYYHCPHCCTIKHPCSTSSGDVNRHLETLAVLLEATALLAVTAFGVAGGRSIRNQGAGHGSLRLAALGMEGSGAKSKWSKDPWRPLWSLTLIKYIMNQTLADLPSALHLRRSFPPATWILGLNALGFLSKMASTALCRVPSFSRLLKQLTQLQASQYRPEAKHSQYLRDRMHGPVKGHAAPGAVLKGVKGISSRRSPPATTLHNPVIMVKRSHPKPLAQPPVPQPSPTASQF